MSRSPGKIISEPATRYMQSKFSDVTFIGDVDLYKGSGFVLDRHALKPVLPHPKSCPWNSLSLDRVYENCNY